MSSAKREPARAPAILCAGIIVLDEVFQVDRFPQPDAKTQAQSFFIGQWRLRRQCRGRGRTARRPSGWPARWPARSAMMRTATACWPRSRAKQVDCSGCQRLAGVPTALSAIFSTRSGERMIVTYRDDRLAAARRQPTRHASSHSADAVLADNRFPEFVRPICEAARARGLMVVLDADRPTQIGDELFRIATHVVFSSECLRATTGRDDLAAALARDRRDDSVVSRRHPWPARRALARGRGAAQEPGLRGRGGRHAGRGRCVPRRVHARAGEGRDARRGDAVRRGGRRAQVHAPRRQHGGPVDRAEVEALLARDRPRRARSRSATLDGLARKNKVLLDTI